jgi:hypothetical protein
VMTDLQYIQPATLVILDHPSSIHGLATEVANP